MDEIWMQIFWKVFLQIYCEETNTICISDIYLWSTSLDLWPPDYTYLWLSSIGYSGAFKLDQSDEQRKNLFQRCLSVWISLHDLLSPYRFWSRYLCDPVWVLLCSGYLSSCSASGHAETALQNKISSIHRCICIYRWKFFCGTYLFQTLLYAATGIWDDFCDSIGIFSYQIFSDT